MIFDVLFPILCSLTLCTFGFRNFYFYYLCDVRAFICYVCIFDPLLYKVIFVGASFGRDV